MTLFVDLSDIRNHVFTNNYKIRKKKLVKKSSLLTKQRYSLIMSLKGAFLKS